MSAEFEARNPGQCGSIGSAVYENVCSPGADVMSVDVEQLQLESAEITKMLAANPSRVDANTLRARLATINTQPNQSTVDDK